MISYYRSRRKGQAESVVVLVAEKDEQMLLRWVPNTGKWNRTPELENDYLFGDEGGVYEAITPDEAASLVPYATPFDESRDVATRLLERFRLQGPEKSFTREELGLNVASEDY